MYLILKGCPKIGIIASNSLEPEEVLEMRNNKLLHFTLKSLKASRFELLTDNLKTLESKTNTTCF